MVSLDKDLQTKKKTLEDFRSITIRVLQYFPNVRSVRNEKNGYFIWSSVMAGTTKYVRPINQKLFIDDVDEFSSKFNEFIKLLNGLKIRTEKLAEEDEFLIDSVVYTIQQSIGAGLDLMVDPNSARKHVGNRFEELIEEIFKKMEVVTTSHEWLLGTS